MDRLVADVASSLHELWCAARRQEDGTVAPRVKDGVDIANTAFSDLPHRWQVENLAAAKSALAAVRVSTSVDQAATLVHQDWLSRNAGWARPDQLVTFAQLSVVEQDKDRVVVRVAAAAAGVCLL